MRAVVLGILLLMLPGLGQLFASEANQFVSKGSLPLETALDFDASSGRAYLLSRGNLSTLDLAAPTPAISQVSRIDVDLDFVSVAASPRFVCLASREGRISIYERTGDELHARSTIELGDSILSILATDNRLFLAQGYEGVGIVNLDDLAVPMVVDVLQDAAYASSVDLSDEALYIVDPLQGVRVYSRNGDSFAFASTILVSSPPVGIAAMRDRVAICLGDDRLMYWDASNAENPTLEFEVHNKFVIDHIDSDPLMPGALLLGGDGGELARLDTETRAVAQFASLGQKAVRVAIGGTANNMQFLALEQSGRFETISITPNAAARRAYLSAESPTGFLATNNGLLMSTSRGIEKISWDISSPARSVVATATTVLTSFSQSGAFLVAANSSEPSIHLYENWRGRFETTGGIPTDLKIKWLFAESDGSGLNVIAVGETGAEKYRVEPDQPADIVWTIENFGAATVADYGDGLLAVCNEYGYCEVYDVVDDDPIRLATTQAASRPRDIEIVDREHFVVAHEHGIQSFQIEGQIIAELQSPIAVNSATDILYDAATHELLIADGRGPVKYLDFANPATLGVVYLIGESEGTYRIELESDNLYCVSNDWLRSFVRTEPGNSDDRERSPFSRISVFPNPFNLSTSIAIELGETADLPLGLDISLVNTLGQTVASRELQARNKVSRIELGDLIGQGTSLPSGMYFVRIRGASHIITQKLLLLK